MITYAIRLDRKNAKTHTVSAESRRGALAALFGVDGESIAFVADGYLAMAYDLYGAWYNVMGRKFLVYAVSADYPAKAAV